MTQMLDLTADLKARLDHFRAGLDGMFLGPVIRDAERALRDCCHLIAGMLLQPHLCICFLLSSMNTCAGLLDRRSEIAFGGNQQPEELLEYAFLSPKLQCDGCCQACVLLRPTAGVELDRSDFNAMARSQTLA